MVRRRRRRRRKVYYDVIYERKALFTEMERV